MTVDQLYIKLGELRKDGHGQKDVAFDAGAYNKHPGVGYVGVEFVSVHHILPNPINVALSDGTHALHNLVELA